MSSARPRPPATWVRWLSLVAVVVLVRFTVLDLYAVSGISMDPTLRDGDVLVVSKLSFGLTLPLVREAVLIWGEPRAGELVIVKRPEDGLQMVKRVAAIAGQLHGDHRVPPGHVWLQGDNQLASDDSRRMGPVPRGLLVGRVLERHWAAERAGGYRWARIGEPR